MNIERIYRNNTKCKLLQDKVEEKSVLIRTLEAKLEAIKKDPAAQIVETEIALMVARSERYSIEREIAREQTNLNLNIDTGLKFAEAVLKTTDDTKTLEFVNDGDLNRSMIFNIDDL
jgi:hypothetical protein